MAEYQQAFDRPYDTSGTSKDTYYNYLPAHQQIVEILGVISVPTDIVDPNHEGFFVEPGE